LASEAARLVSLDAFRGIAIAAMILVNNPGSWSAVYWPLLHAEWHGWTPTDLVFPFFLFAVGVSIQLSRRKSYGSALRRAAILFALGLLMAAFPHFDLARLRVPGVLQRIALCYLAAFVVRRAFGAAGQVAACAASLVGYWLLMTRVPVPDGPPPNLDPGKNLAAWVDRLLLEGHLWRQTRTWDPEGVLSTLPAIATTLLGVLAGVWLRSDRPPFAKAVGLMGAGLLLEALGVLWHASFPINKNLWTSSYALFTAGLASAALGLVYLAADVHGRRGWARPGIVFGRNAIFVFVASGLVAKALLAARPGGVSLQARIHATVFEAWLPPFPASLAHAAAILLAWYLVLLWMDRKGLYFKV
jgi:predicted acyltransferase